MLSSSRGFHASRSRRARLAGFTVVELMVAITVLAILLALAVPTFTSIINANRLAAPANEVLTGLQLARATAISRNARVVFCRTENGTTCNTSGGNWGGWMSFIDGNGDFAPDAAADNILRTGTIVAPVTLQASTSAASSRIVFRPDGMARADVGDLIDATLRICMPTTQPNQNIRDVELVAGSRASVAQGDGSGACDAPSDP